MMSPEISEWFSATIQNNLDKQEKERQRREKAYKEWLNKQQSFNEDRDDLLEDQLDKLEKMV